MDSILILSLLVFTLFDVLSAEYCKTFYKERWRYEYCEYACCDKKCCSVDVALIVGAIIGSLCFIGFVVFIIVCLLCMKKKKSQGRVVAAPDTATTIVTATVSPPSYQQFYAHPNPAYGDYLSQPYPPVQPPGYAPPQHLDPAYPPPPALYSGGYQQPGTYQPTI